MIVYLDTNGWTELTEWISSHGISILRAHEFIFSSCVLDEIAAAQGARAQILAETTWRLSNRRKLKDHLEMTVAEIVASQNKQKIIPIYDTTDQNFHQAWNTLRKSGLTKEFISTLKQQQNAVKGDFKSHLKLSRSLLKMYPQSNSIDSWANVYKTMEDDGEIHTYIYNILKTWDLIGAIPNPEGIKDISLNTLPCTASWVQYFIGLSFLSSFGSGRISRPDLGDQVDFRHACYAGIADKYVTGDKRMVEILSDFVYKKNADIVDVKEFISLCKKK